MAGFYTKYDRNLVSSGSKSAGRITLSILQSFLYFLKVKDKNSCLKQLLKQFFREARENDI